MVTGGVSGIVDFNLSVWLGVSVVDNTTKLLIDGLPRLVFSFL